MNNTSATHKAVVLFLSADCGSAKGPAVADNERMPSVNPVGLPYGEPGVIFLAPWAINHTQRSLMNSLTTCKVSVNHRV